MKAWRLSRFDSIRRTFDGEGARLFPGRWNSRGVPVVYASEHLSLAALEILVHARIDQLRVVFHAFEITVPDALIEQLPDELLPLRWDAAAIPRATRDLGSTWARELRSVALSVPSAVVRQERNILLNPLHLQLRELAIARPTRFRFDARLLEASRRPPA
jgi:RES domain-containing protein